MFYSTIFATITLLSIATGAPTLGASNTTEVDTATMPKANEYRSPDCTGGINYGHHNFGLGQVTMDDTTHSVYLVTGQNPDNTPRGVWMAFEGKDHNGGSCTGQKYGNYDVNNRRNCINLDDGWNGQRVRCVALG